MVFLVVEPARALRRQFVIAIPRVRRFGPGTGAAKIKGRRFRKGLHAQTAADRLHVHVSLRGVRQAVISAVIHQDLGRKSDRGAGAHHECIARKSCSRRAPSRCASRCSASAQAKVHTGVVPSKRKRSMCTMARRINGATRPAIGAERVAFAVVFHHLIDFGNQKGALPPRRESGHQQPVIAARERARDRATGKPSHAVRHQPLARLRGGEIAADLAPKVDKQRLQRGFRHNVRS